METTKPLLPGDDRQRHFAFCVQYRGTTFSGWQRQLDQLTVQGELERALGTIANADVAVRAAGRTDAGVHASGQIAGFQPKRIDRLLNGYVV